MHHHRFVRASSANQNKRNTTPNARSFSICAAKSEKPLHPDYSLNLSKPHYRTESSGTFD
jgi:hypothetical protein